MKLARELRFQTIMPLARFAERLSTGKMRQAKI